MVCFELTIKIENVQTLQFNWTLIMQYYWWSFSPEMILGVIFMRGYLATSYENPEFVKKMHGFCLQCKSSYLLSL